MSKCINIQSSAMSKMMTPAPKDFLQDDMSSQFRSVSSFSKNSARPKSRQKSISLKNSAQKTTKRSNSKINMNQPSINMTKVRSRQKLLPQAKSPQWITREDQTNVGNDTYEPNKPAFTNNNNDLANYDTDKSKLGVRGYTESQMLEDIESRNGQI